MAGQLDAYVDTSALIAFADASDTYHPVFRRFGDQDLTLVDAIGLHLMRDGHVASCWSTDRHLGLTGTTLAIHTA